VSQFAPYVEIWQRNDQDPDNPKAWIYHHYEPGDTVVLASINVQVDIGAFYRGLSFDDEEE
jgi:hypothetical protein